jgi:undecaprenyl phosphate-alpha-L-ara4FN deformylase
MPDQQTVVGLRIDVDTMRGTLAGVPNLVSILNEHGIRGTFFFSVGPDNMGRHLWRLFRPSFLLKMLRSKAVSLYGLDILLRGTFWPGTQIAKKGASQINMAAADHEIGLHAWDHHREQSGVEKLTDGQMYRYLEKGKSTLEGIIGRRVECSAAPSWRVTDELLQVKERFDFLYNSDCRGHSIFTPMIPSGPVDQPQIPATLPTYDELIGQQGITEENYNQHVLELLRPGQLNVLTIHAEVEGIACREMFCRFLQMASTRSIGFQPLGEQLALFNSGDTARITRKITPGREGWVACQEPGSG